MAHSEDRPMKPTTPEERESWLKWAELWETPIPGEETSFDFSRRLIADADRLTKERDEARGEVSELEMIISNAESEAKAGEADYLSLRDEADAYRVERDEARKLIEAFKSERLHYDRKNLDRLTKERDEARADAESLRILVKKRTIDPSLQELEKARHELSQALTESERLTKERDQERDNYYVREAEADLLRDQRDALDITCGLLTKERDEARAELRERRLQMGLQRRGRPRQSDTSEGDVR